MSRAVSNSIEFFPKNFLYLRSIKFCEGCGPGGRWFNVLITAQCLVASPYTARALHPIAISMVRELYKLEVL